MSTSDEWIAHLTRERRPANTVAAARRVMRSLPHADTATREDVEAWWASRAHLSPATRSNDLHHQQGKGTTMHRLLSLAAVLALAACSSAAPGARLCYRSGDSWADVRRYALMTPVRDIPAAAAIAGQVAPSSRAFRMRRSRPALALAICEAIWSLASCAARSARRDSSGRWSRADMPRSIYHRCTCEPYTGGVL